MLSPPLPRRQLAAFTLIELLVVVAIIALLMSILTPSLSQARKQAKATHCKTRLNEMLKATTAYGGDNDFKLPRMQFVVCSGETSDCNDDRLYGWAEVLYEYVYDDQNYTRDKTGESSSGSYPVMRNFENRFELWTCQSANPVERSSGHYRVYELTWRMGTLDKVPQRLPLIADANPIVTYDHPCSEYEDKDSSYISRERLAGLEGEAYIDERHYGGANVVFADGHVERSTTLREEPAADWDLNPDTDNE